MTTARERRHMGRPRTGKVVPCPVCRKHVYRSPSLLSRRYCGLACRDAAKRAERVKDGEARCARCREWKPLNEFPRGSGGVPHSYCKPCYSAWTYDNKGTPPEKRARYRPAYKLTEEQKRANKRDANRMQHMARRAAGAKPHKFDVGRMFCLQDARCFYCGVMLDKYHVDHKLPVSRGGTNDLGNLHLTCPKCNMRKGAMTHEEFLASKKRPVRTWTEEA